jgi:tetratricopeptide (TPR) repeat protein
MEKISNIKGKKKALIIAISEYDNLPKEKQLPFCKSDGEAIYQILQEQEYEILDDWKLIGTVTSDQLKRAIFDFFRRQAESRDTLLFYFSGHGIPDGFGSHYLASTDIDPDYPDDRGYAFSSIQERVKMSVAKKIITILDCCFSGAAGITMGSEEDIAKLARAAMDRTFEEGYGKCVLASSLGDQVSYKKKDEEYSLFTYYLLEGLRGNGEAVNLEGHVTPSTLGKYVWNGVTSEDRRQRPITKTEMSGDIVLAYYPRPVEEVPVRPSRHLQETEKLRALLDSARDSFLRREYKRANKFFERVLEIEPNHIEALNSKGISLYWLGEYDGAKSCFDKVLEIDPKNILAQSNLEILPKKNDADAWNNKGDIFYDLGRYERAISSYNKAIELNPNYVDAWNNKGNALHNLGRYEEAINCYSKAIKLNPNEAKAWHNKGVTFDKLGWNKDAGKCFLKARKLGFKD